MAAPEGFRAQFGDTGTDVTAWQRLLVKKGFVVVVDGDYGPSTFNASTQACAWAGVGFIRYNAKGERVGIVTEGHWRAVEKKARPNPPSPQPGRPTVRNCKPGSNGFPNGPGNWGSRSVGDIHGVCGHYTGGMASFLNDAVFHTTSDYLTDGGAPAIAYTIGIELGGVIDVFNPLHAVTWHCDGEQNTRQLGVVFLGGADGMTPAQVKSVGWLIDALKRGDPSLMRLLEAPELVNEGLGSRPWTTHRHVKATTCPGEKGEGQYRSLVKQAGLRFEP